MIKDILLDKIKPYIMPYEAYLTGGYMRDILSGAQSSDRDITIKCPDLKELSIKIADETGGSFVELDSENEIYRICYENDEYIDLAQMLTSVEIDTKRRDFTINAIMYDVKNDKIIDLTNGKEDFKNKIIRTYKIENLEDDYLRMLRAFRFQAQTGFKIEENIINFIIKNGSKINNIAPERIHQELIKTFEGKYIVSALNNMEKTGFLESIFPVFSEIKKIPPNSHHHLPLTKHLIETVNQIRINNPLLKLAGLLHDLAKPDCWTIEEDTGRHRFIGHDELGGKKVIPILKKLKFSNKEIDYISKMIKHHIYPSALMAQPDKSEKAIIRFIRKIEYDTPDLIELARADRLSARGEAVSDDMIKANLANLDLLLDYYEKISPRLKALPKLINGVEIMQILNISPSKQLGDIIDEIKELQIEGKITSKEDAISYIKSLKK